MRRVVDEAVTVAVAEVSDPADRGVDGREQPRTVRRRDGAPAHGFGGDKDVQRRGVHRAVVARPLAEWPCPTVFAQFVHDLARLLAGLWIDRSPLQFGQLVEHTAGELRRERQRHVRRQEGVSPEQRHVPGGAGCDDRQFGVGGVEDAQGRQILERLAHSDGQPWVGRDDRGDSLLPRLVAVVRQVIDVRGRPSAVVVPSRSTRSTSVGPLVTASRVRRAR